jgi:hypothetical protein
MWPLLLAELTVSAAFIGLLVHALYRYDRHVARIEAELDLERAAVIASVRQKVDAAIAELTVSPVARTAPEPGAVDSAIFHAAVSDNAPNDGDG